MPYDPAIHHRRSIRLRGFDYTRNGAYFVTILTHRRWPLFGRVVGGVMRLSEAGWLTQAAWADLPIHYPQVMLDAWVIMPDHVHGVLWLTGEGGGPDVAMRRHGLSEIVRAFKTFSARRINEWRGVSGVPVWHRNYYERIIRNDDALWRIRRYIAGNPTRW